MGETIFRKVKGKENPYAQVDKLLIRDFRLALDTRGLLQLLLSMPDDWEVRFSHLIEASPAKKTALRRMIKDAVRHGYMHRERVNGGGHGQFRWVTYVYESPDLNPHFDPDADPTIGRQPSAGFRPMAPSAGYPSMGDPSMGNLPIYRYILVLRADWTENENDGRKAEALIFDDDGVCQNPPAFFVHEDRTDDLLARASREAALLTVLPGPLLTSLTLW